MLPRHHKLTSSDQFRRTIKKGKRGGSRTVVVHLYDTATASGDTAGSGHRRMYMASTTAESAKNTHQQAPMRSADSAQKSAGSELPYVRRGGPRCGLIVSKAVGNAVARHRTSRRLRHVLAKLIAEIPARYDLVIRALPAAGEASSAELEKDLRKALAKSEKTQ